MTALFDQPDGTLVQLYREDGRPLSSRPLLARSVWRRLIGFMFRRRLRPGEALLMMHPEGIQEAAIHMRFVFCPLGVIWFSNELVVVDKLIARPWGKYYAPRAAAVFTLEGDVGLVEEVEVGERVRVGGVFE